MNYKIIDIEGIGEVYAPKLIAEGIETVEQLLDACSGPTGRKIIAEKTGISEKLILKWTNHADLFRINGMKLQVWTLSRNCATVWQPTLLPRLPRSTRRSTCADAFLPRSRSRK